MDWIRLGSSGCDLAGTRGVITPVTYTELAKHNKIQDGWIAIRGKVYNVTRYMDFHPGGEFFILFCFKFFFMFKFVSLMNLL